MRRFRQRSVDFRSAVGRTRAEGRGFGSHERGNPLARTGNQERTPRRLRRRDHRRDRFRSPAKPYDEHLGSFHLQLDRRVRNVSSL